MKKCPKCGGAEFTASQVQKHWVIVDGDGKFIRNKETRSNDPITGPYICNSCNAEYQRLDELFDEPEYTGFTFFSCITGGSYPFEGPVSEKELMNALYDQAIKAGLPYGYFLFSAASDDGRSKRTGAIRVSKDPFGKKKIDLAEAWKEYDTISMPAASTYLNDYLNATRIDCKDGRLKNLYSIRTGECDYVFHAYPKARIIDNTMDIGVQIEIETLDPFVTYKCIINSSLAYEDLIIRYRCCDPDSYDPDARILYSSCEMYETYRRKVDKHEYPNYDCWLADMLKSGVFVKL